MKWFSLSLAMVALSFTAFLALTGCNRSDKVSAGSPVAPTNISLPGTVCWLTTDVTVPLSPSGDGRYVIRNTSDWETYNHCANGASCPVPPVDLTQKMLLVTEAVYTHGCPCTPTSESITKVCTDGTQVTVDVVQSIPAGCDPAATPVPGTCTLGPVTLLSAVSVDKSDLPVSWVITAN